MFYVKVGKWLPFVTVFFVLVFSSCSSIPSNRIDYSYPQSGSSNNASIAVKDYQAVGIIFVKSTEIIDVNGNHTGSKITYERLMLEVQKLNADDFINLRIDVNYVQEYDSNNVLTRTLYNYTANALAIKYTTAIAGVSAAANLPIIRNNDDVEAVKEKRFSPRSIANARNNWLSAEATMAGPGLRYERMLGKNLSLGANFYYQYLSILSIISWDFPINEIGIDAMARIYPVGGAFYIGAGLGYRFFEEDEGYYDYDYYYDYYYYGFYINSNGFAISPELGWKIDVGTSGGLFMDVGVKGSLIFGGIYNITFSIVPHIGFGWAF